MEWTAPEAPPIEEPFRGGERAMLEGFLDRQRSVLLGKCAGLTGARLAERAVPPSNLSLLGLIRHLTDGERVLFRICFAREPGLRLQYQRFGRRDRDFAEADAVFAQRDYERLVAEAAAARAAVAGMGLDEEWVSDTHGRRSLRWCYQHMIEEYARHNGHADLLRERVDGRVGD